MFYISVTQGSDMGGDFLLQVRPLTGEILSGTAMIPWHKGSRDNDVGTPMFRHVLGLDEHEEEQWERDDWWHTLHVLELSEDGWYEKDQLLPVHYVWWVDEAGRMGVVTTRNIFIMGESGQTIARVR